MDRVIFKSEDVTKGGFIVFYDDKLISIKLAKDFVKDTSRMLKQKSREENNNFLYRLMDTREQDFWEAFPDSFLNMEPSEITGIYPDATLLEYADINKFKLSGTTGPVFDEGVQTTYPGQLLIKGNGEKIAMDHNYDSNDPVYKQIADLKTIVLAHIKENAYFSCG